MSYYVILCHIESGLLRLKKEDIQDLSELQNRDPSLFLSESAELHLLDAIGVMNSHNVGDSQWLKLIFQDLKIQILELFNHQQMSSMRDEVLSLLAHKITCLRRLTTGQNESKLSADPELWALMKTMCEGMCVCMYIYIYMR